MSYSVCLNCKAMVSNYQKYCDYHALDYHQDEKFWAGRGYDIMQEPARTLELARDMKRENNTATAVLEKMRRK